MAGERSATLPALQLVTTRFHVLARVCSYNRLTIAGFVGRLGSGHRRSYCSQSSIGDSLAIAAFVTPPLVTPL